MSLDVRRGEVVALVGESGSGKSTLGKVVLGLHRPDGGRVRFAGKDVFEGRRSQSLAYRGQVQMIFQDPFGSLNPVHTVAHHIERPLLRHRKVRGRPALRERVLALLTDVGLTPAAEFADAFPFALSGGQRQRVAIARALAPEPELIVADEPTSMLDVSIRVGVLNLLDRLRQERGLAFLLITHDLASARYLADRVVVLFRGKVVEEAPAEELLASPRHPYSQLLLSAIPTEGVDLSRPLPVSREVLAHGG